MVTAVRTHTALGTVVQDVVAAADTAGLPVVSTDGRPVGRPGRTDALRALVPTT